MKSTFAIVMTLFVTLTSFGTNNSLIFGDNNVVVATFKGVTDDGEYKFIDANKTVLLFSEISEEIDLDLSDSDNVNSKFSITWENAESEVYDEEGEPTGETVTIKRIIKLKAAK